MNAQANSDDDSAAAEVVEKSEAAATSNADDKSESADAPAEGESKADAAPDGPDKDDDSEDDGKVPFTESDYRETKMTYDHGKLPLYVAAVWVVGLVGLVVYYIGYGLPDLEQWGSP